MECSDDPPHRRKVFIMGGVEHGLPGQLKMKKGKATAKCVSEAPWCVALFWSHSINSEKTMNHGSFPSFLQLIEFL